MSYDDDRPPTLRTSARAVRAVIRWAGLGIVLVVLWSFIGDYRAASVSAESTTTPEVVATTTIADGEPYVLVLSDGLNLRAEPSTTSAIVKVLEGSQQLVLIEEGTGWYHVRDATGAEGWVAAGGRYTELVQP